MRVFKGYMKLISRNWTIIALYTGIFTAIALMIGGANKEDSITKFEASRIAMTVIDRDGGELSSGLIEYLEGKHDLVELPDDKAALQEALFYRNVRYIVTIPEGFEYDFLADGTGIQVTQVPGSTDGYYVNQQLNTFLNCVKTFYQAGYSMEEAITLTIAQSDHEAGVNLSDRNGNGGIEPDYYYTLRYYPYLYIAIIGYVLGLVTLAFREREVKRRISCSPVSLMKQNIGAFAAFVIVGVGLYLVSQLLPILISGEVFLKSNNLNHLLLNSFVLMLVALALAFAISNFARTANSVNGLVNTVSLTMCFLGGAFVPLSILGEGVKQVSRFLPVYWYELNLDILAKHAVLTDALRKEIYWGYGMQLVFAVACLGIGAALTKYRAQERG